MTLLEKILNTESYECKKHALSEDCQTWTEDKINAMSNVELLQIISTALEEVGKRAQSDGMKLAEDALVEMLNCSGQEQQEEARAMATKALKALRKEGE